MHLASDYIHPTPHKGRCRIRTYLPEEDRDAPVVICTELANNPGASVTNAVRRIAAEAIESHGLSTPLVWVETRPKPQRATSRGGTISDFLYDKDRDKQ